MASRLLRDAITMRSGIGSNFGSSLRQGLHLGPLPATHRQPLVGAFQYHRPPRLPLGLGSALESADPSPRHEAIAVNADEHLAKLLLDLRERFLDQVFSSARAQGDVLELGPQIDHVRYRNEHHSPALGN